jgi:D-sedoheptulose 7-phosphate isomerase
MLIRSGEGSFALHDLERKKDRKEMMSNLEQMCLQAGSISEFAAQYFEYLATVLRTAELPELDRFGQQLDEARARGNTIFVAGNGGSASTATTMANDLGFDVLKKAKTERPLKVLSLTDNVSVMTAIANDVGYENIFVNQLRVHYRPGDKLVVISASGNSPNLIRAVEWVRSSGGVTIALLGFEGGALLKMSDIAVHFHTRPGEYGPVEDAHLIVNHVLAHWFQIKYLHT